jgi:aminoglycoside phosphotransferase (APT) family kinase protein
VNDPAARLAVVERAVPARLAGAALVESWSNDTWVADTAVLRVCWRGDRRRMLRERAVLAALPASVPHAEVLDAGETGGLTWLLLRRIPGERLDLAWPSLPARHRSVALASLGEALAALHEWAPPPAVRDLLAAADAVNAGAQGTSAVASRIVGSAIVPLPAARLWPLLDLAGGLPGMDPAVLVDARARIERLLPAAADAEFTGGGVVHADAHLANALWHDGRMSALLDFEWARLGPPDLELEAVCRDEPDLETLAEHRTCDAAQVPVLAGLQAGYPGLFQRADLTQRLWLYELCYQVRSLHATNDGVTPMGGQALARLHSLARRPRVRFT